jgi:hypothetical protein
MQISVTNTTRDGHLHLSFSTFCLVEEGPGHIKVGIFHLLCSSRGRPFLFATVLLLANVAFDGIGDEDVLQFAPRHDPSRLLGLFPSKLIRTDVGFHSLGNEHIFEVGFGRADLLLGLLLLPVETMMQKGINDE